MQSQNKKQQSLGPPKIWNSSTLKLTQKKAHFKQIISISIRDQNTFLTSSDDNTVRLWDLRNNSSIKMINSQVLKQKQIGHCSNDNKNIVFIPSGQMIYSFDIRKQQQIFIKNYSHKIEQPHNDQINQIVYSSQYNIISACDDEGDIKIYSVSQLKLQKQLLDKHINMCYTCDFIYPIKKNKTPILVSSGFDCLLNLWNVQNQKCEKTINIKQLLINAELQSQTLPLIHSVYCHKNTIFASTQTGHIICLPYNQPKKPKFILQASLAKVVRCQLAKNINQNLLLSLSGDQSFSIFDYTKRQKGYPEFIQKYKVQNTPNWIETMRGTILVATILPELSIYTIKG